jgi:hypothetical protein
MKFPNSIYEGGRVPVINKLYEQPLNISEAYKLAKFVKSLKEKEGPYLQAKLKVFEKYGVKSKKTGNWEITDKKKQDIAVKEIDELLLLEEEFDLDSKIKVSNQDVKMSAKEISLLEDIIEIVG